MPGKLRYTLDGSIPNGKSPIYKKPVRVQKMSSVRFAYVSKAGKAGEVARVDCLPAHLEKVINPKKGWKLAYYQGEWSKVPDFATLKPVITGYVNRIGFDVRHRDEEFALHLNGYFKAEKEGVYNFGISSDDGSWLKVGGALVVDNDGPHSNSEKMGKVWLPKGWHKIEVGYFQGTGAFALTLDVQSPGAKKPVSADSNVYIDGK
jgi:hypothetical protein